MPTLQKHLPTNIDQHSNKPWLNYIAFCTRYMEVHRKDEFNRKGGRSSVAIASCLYCQFNGRHGDNYDV